MVKSKYSHISFWKGKKLSKEHREKLRLAKLGKKGIGMTGRKHSEETRLKMRIKKIGYIPWNKNKKMSEEYCEIMRKSQTGIKRFKTRDGNHHNWKGEKASLYAIHVWIRRRKYKPTVCEECGIKPPCDLANISQEYKRDVNDYEWLCRKCHMTKDGRLEKARERMSILNMKQ